MNFTKMDFSTDFDGSMIPFLLTRSKEKNTLNCISPMGHLTIPGDFLGEPLTESQQTLSLFF